MDQNLNAEIRGEDSCSQEAVRAELQKILGSRTFRAAQGQRKFLAFAVGEVLAGRAHLLKEYVIATEALGRAASFDPRLDPIVRTEARKLRARLAKYYQTEGSNNPLRLEFRKGSYAPFFSDAVPPGLEAPNEVSGEASESAPITAPVTVPPPPSPLAPSPDRHRIPPPRNGLFATIGIVMLATIGFAILYLSHHPLTETTFAANDASLAVLPLVNLGDNNEEFLSDGLTDELINSLKQVPGLQVVARTSAFRFKAKALDPREIEKLHVRAILVGTVRKVENRLRVAVQLNSAESGYHLWSGSYERESGNMGTISPEIVSAITNALGVGLARGGRNSIQMPASPNSEAHEDYLRGLYFRNRYNVESLNRAIQYFKQAIAEDPSFARAYAGLADCYSMERAVAATPPLQMVSKIRQAASKAIELDPTLGEPHFDLAVSAEYEFDWATAGREFQKGLALSPDDVVGRLWYAWYLALTGRNKEEVLAQRTIAAKLDPVSPYAVESLGDYYSAVGRYDVAVEQFHNALALEPNFGLAHQDLGDAYLLQKRCGSAIEELRLANASMPGPRRMADLGYGYAVCGRTDEARRILRGFLQETGRDAVPALAIAVVYMGLGDKDRTFPWLEKAIDERDLGMGLRWDGYFESLRSDPRFNGLLRRMKLD